MKTWKFKLKVNDKLILNNIVAFFIFQSLFITFRILVIGSRDSSNAFEFFISSLPDLFALYIFALVLLNGEGKISYKNFSLLDKIIFGFIFSNIILGTFLAGNIMLSLYAIRMSYFPMIFYFIARFGIKADSDQFEIVTKKIVNWYIIIGIIGLILYFFMPEVMEYMTLKSGAIVLSGYIIRIGSVFWSPVVFASFMSVCAIYFYYKILQKDNIWYYLLFSLFWCCLFLSVTRGAIITFFIGWVVLTIMYGKYRAFLKSTGFIAIVMIILWFVDPSVYKVSAFIAESSVETMMLTKGYSRVDLWIASFEDFIEKPMGYGLGKAGHVAVRFFGKLSKEAAVSSTDGWYLKLANETGLWGLLTYFTLIITFFIQSIKYLRKIKHSFFNFLFVIFLMVGVQNIVSNVNDFYSFSCLFWLIIGFSQNLIVLSWITK